MADSRSKINIGREKSIPKAPSNTPTDDSVNELDNVVEALALLNAFSSSDRDAAESDISDDDENYEADDEDDVLQFDGAEATNNTALPSLGLARAIGKLFAEAAAEAAAEEKDEVRRATEKAVRGMHFKM